MGSVMGRSWGLNIAYIYYRVILMTIHLVTDSAGDIPQTSHANTNTEIHTQKYKYRKTNTEIQIQKCKYKIHTWSRMIQEEEWFQSLTLTPHILTRSLHSWTCLESDKYKYPWTKNKSEKGKKSI